MTKDIKKLTPAELKKQVKKLDAVQEFVITIGETDYKLTHDIVFRKTKMQKVLEDMMYFFAEVTEDTIDLLQFATPYSSLLVIKHFTSLEVPNDIQEAIDLMEVLVDLGAFGEIINTLPEKEVLKVFDLISQTLEEVQANMDDLEKEAQELVDEVQDPELKKALEEVVADKEAVEDNGEV